MMLVCVCVCVCVCVYACIQVHFIQLKQELNTDTA